MADLLISSWSVIASKCCKWMTKHLQTYIKKKPFHEILPCRRAADNGHRISEFSFLIGQLDFHSSESKLLVNGWVMLFEKSEWESKRNQLKENRLLTGVMWQKMSWTHFVCLCVVHFSTTIGKILWSRQWATPSPSRTSHIPAAAVGPIHSTPRHKFAGHRFGV